MILPFPWPSEAVSLLPPRRKPFLFFLCLSQFQKASSPPNDLIRWTTSSSAPATRSVQMTSTKSLSGFNAWKSSWKWMERLQKENKREMVGDWEKIEATMGED
ncbi:hypothetical protein L6452_14699 [Arctium lappa]|uniref:Uncharacterized protein n=1 Tax=Arctium lappa TaxID=4217 RepID=A0ACB9CLK9_ARCLA|nr:hypothetical protein L6452_14699 [Arctium lappa]